MSAGAAGAPGAISPPHATGVLGATGAPPLEDALDEVLDRGLLHMVFQPICYLDGQFRVGYESLARFDYEPRCPPNLWFDAAARVGRRLELELHAVRLAAAALTAYPEGAYLSINASPSTVMSGELAPALAAAPLNRVVLEVTEEEPIESYEEFAAVIRPLRASGMRLAVDDVGAGFASLTHLVRLDPDILKLDRALIDHVSASKKMRALAAAMTSFALEIGAAVIAEGIETREQLALLSALGVSLGQGYLLGRPGPLP